MDWNDLNLLLELVDHQGIGGAAKSIGVHPTTISRKVRKIEANLQVQLFHRFTHKVVLTEAGADAVDVARNMRTLTDELTARLQGQDTRLAGVVRLTSFDSLLRAWMGDFARFQAQYPDIQVELASGIAMANLTQREADIAVRIASVAPDHLIGAKLCTIAHGVYASVDLLAANPDATRDSLPWISYDKAVFRGVDGYLAARHPDARIVMRVPRIDLLMAAIEDSVGIGILNCHAGDKNPRLRRLGPADAGVSNLWVLTHPQLRGAARISAFMAYLRKLVDRDRDLFEGRRPQA